MTVIKKSKIGKISLLEETETDGHLLEEGNEITDVNVNDVEAPLMDDEKATQKASNTRWVALFLCCFSFFGTYFNSTLMQILQTYVMLAFGMTLTQFNSINSFSAIPVMFLPFISGILIDRFGLRKIYVVAGFLSLAGYGIIAYGIFQRHFSLLVVGTVISSLGDAPLNICKNAMLVKWFVGKELSFALGMALCVCRLGSSISSFFSPVIYTNFGNNLTLPFIVGVVISSISFINTICLVILDKKTDTDSTNTETGGKAKTKAVGLKDLRRFSLIYFLMLFNIGFTYTAVFGFTSNAPNMIAERFGFKPDEAGKLLTIIYICPLIITPTVGALTDKYGKRMIIILVGSFILVATHIGVLLLKDTPEGSEDRNYLIAVGLLAIGIFYSSYAAIIWPCVALVVTEKLTGLAFGLIGTFQTLLGVIYPLGLGYLHDHTERSHGYYWYQVAIIGFGVLSLVFALGLFVSDQKNGGKLNKPGTKRKLSVRERVYSQLSTGG